MKLSGKVSSGLPLLVLALAEEAQSLDTRLPVLLTGIGKVNAACALAGILGRGPLPARIVNLGTAGALRWGLSGIHPVNTVIQHDLDTDLLRTLTGVSVGGPITVATSDEGLTLATGDAFIANVTDRNHLADQAHLVDMEGYALAAAASEAGVPIEIVKYVSDDTDESAAGSWRDNVAKAARSLADWAAQNLIEALSEPRIHHCGEPQRGERTLCQRSNPAISPLTIATRPSTTRPRRNLLFFAQLPQGLATAHVLSFTSCRGPRPYQGALVNSLLLGIGISDRAAPGDDPVADAVTAEALGYDFVSAFDHPVADAVTAEAVGYGLLPATGHPARTYPTFETQTLLTWIAARTTRIGIVPRVLGVPFRPPALVAKAAESLQRLSRGRLILGLGAGYRDEEIRAVGGPDLTPGAKVDGLQDAIAIMRAAWTQRVVSYHGGVYSVDGLDLEPKPAEPIPIWLGALGPRGLALTGRLADGWIPFLRFAGPDRIPELLDRIRTASVAADRPPDAVRAVYSVPVCLDPRARTTSGVIAGSAADIIEQLHGFAELGFTGFDLMPARDQMRALAEDVVPALRELGVPARRSHPSRSPDRESAAVRSAPRRRPAA